MIRTAPGISAPFDTIAFGQPVAVRFNPTIAALPPRYKDEAVMNIQYLDVDQGMASPYVYSLLEDRRGHIWFGTYNGMSRYDGKNLLHVTESDGLINAQIISMLEDSKGHIWFGTQGGGVCRFDGHQFTQFTESDGLGNNVVRAIFEDRTGNIWFGTNGGGAVCYDGKTLKRYTTENGLSGNRIWSILQDQQGAMWFASVDGGITRFHGNIILHYTEKQGLPTNKVRTLALGADGTIYAGTHGGGLWCLSGNDITIYSETDGLSSGQISVILVDQDQSLWLGTPGAGIMHLSRTKGQTYTMHTITESEGLSNNRVSALFADRDGNIWIGTEGGGADRYDPDSFRHITSTDGISNSYVYGLAEDKEGNLWMATSGGGVERFDGTSFSGISTAQGLANDNVWSVLSDSKGNIWIGTYGGGAAKYDGKTLTKYTTANGLPHDKVVCMAEDGKGNIWIGTDGGGVCRFDGQTFTWYGEREGLSNNSIRSLLADDHGRIWIGTNGGGACMFNGKTLTHYTPKEGLIHASVLCMARSVDGAIWFGTGGGVSRLFESRFTSFTQADGLSNDLVWSVGEDKDHVLWFGTMGGLTRLEAPLGNAFSKAEAELSVFTKEDGLRSNDFTLNSVLCDKNGQMWWGTGTVLSALRPDKNIDKEKPLLCYMDRLEIDQQVIDFRSLNDTASDSRPMADLGPDLGQSELGVPVAFFNYPSTLTLSHDLNHLTFHFTTTDWVASHKVKYQYRLDGGDWSPASGDNKAVFTNVPLGEHDFQVRAMGSSGMWNTPFQYRFTIEPPLWWTWWAKLIYLLMFIALLIAIFRWRTRSLIARQHELESLVMERTSDLVAEKTTVTRQKEHVEKQNKEILQSIDYAKRLQEGVLPATTTFNRLFSDFFLLYLPRDIVSGDFYWAEARKGERYFAVGDCTGHGVPGAMLSIIGLNGLHRCLNELNLKEPKDFLTQLTQEIESTFEGGGTMVRDGMDIALCKLTENPLKLTYSGANIPLWVIRGEDLIEVNADRRPIGYFEIERAFTQIEMPLLPGDIIYLFSDGYTSQQGGKHGKKVMRGQFRNLLLALQDEPLSKQKEQLRHYMTEWMQGFEQTDDVCILAVRV